MYNGKIFRFQVAKVTIHDYEDDAHFYTLFLLKYMYSVITFTAIW